jgi:hypothetical protein
MSAGAAAGWAVAGPPFARAQDDDLRLETIHENGPASNRLCLVFAAEGFDARNLDQFDRVVSSLARGLAAHPIFAEYANFVNLYRIAAASRRPWDGSGEGTIFGVKVGTQNKDLAVDWNAVQKRMPAALPKKHVLSLIVQGAEAMRAKGGGQPRQGKLATGSTWDVFLHEMGHALGMLGDEYPDGGAISEELSINVSSTGRDVPWAPLLAGSPKGLGVYKVPGIRRTFWKGEEECIMGQNLDDFGPVCRWGMTMGILRHVRLIDEVSPRASVVSSKDADRLSAKFLHPKGHALRTRWAARKVESERDFAALPHLTGRSVKWETLEGERGWRALRPVGDAALLSDLEPGRHIVVAYAEDPSGWIVADPWGTSRDVAAWGVEKRDK